MSGHSKWSKIKHQKGASDVAKSKTFTKLGTAITIAVRSGAGNSNPDSNFKLRLAIEKAREFNMPKVNIERAIEKASGLNGPNLLEEIVYEGIGPMGIGLIIVTHTDNRQRTVSDIKNTLERHGGVLAKGAVMPLFDYAGFIILDKKNADVGRVLEIAMDSGAIDLEETDEDIIVITPKDLLHKVKDELISHGFLITDYELFYRPKTYIPLPDKDKKEQLLALVEKLEDLDDVARVYSNLDL